MWILLFLGLWVISIQVEASRKGEDFNQNVIMMVSKTLNWIFVTGIDCLVLYTILRLSNRVDEDRAAKITQSLRDSFRVKSQHNNELEERLRFQKRLSEYRWLADE